MVQFLTRTRRWLLAISPFCALFVLSFGWESKAGQQMIEQSFLQNDLKIGQVLRLSSFTKASSGTVCALYPYQEFVTEGDPESVRINAHLKAIGYMADEGHWAIVVVEPEAVHLSKFKLSKKLDILALHKMQTEHKVKPPTPKDFKPARCSSVHDAAITKIEWQGRIYLVMGRAAS